MTSKKVLIFDRLDSLKYPGGDTVQINAIYKFLTKHGYIVDVLHDIDASIKDYDVALIFNLTRPFEAFIQAKAATAHHIPYILFPVYWDLDSLCMDEGKVISFKKMIPQRMKTLFRALKFWREEKFLLQETNIKLRDIISNEKMMQYIFENATYICPNSNAEFDHLLNKFPSYISKKKVKVILNGYDAEKINNCIDLKTSIELPESFICCVGGIGPRKNQLNLVKAANITGVNLLVIGRTSKGAEHYGKTIKKIANRNVQFIDYLNQDEIFSILRKSKGHIQPSYIETPGLSSLEAARLGCPIGVSDVGPVKEYFGQKAFYCVPNSVFSISECLLKLIQGEKQYFDWGHLNWEIVLIPLDDLLKSIEV